jgi:hypothetical protein
VDAVQEDVVDRLLGRRDLGVPVLVEPGLEEQLEEMSVGSAKRTYTRAMAASRSAGSVTRSSPASTSVRKRSSVCTATAARSSSRPVKCA